MKNGMLKGPKTPTQLFEVMVWGNASSRPICNIDEREGVVNIQRIDLCIKIAMPENITIRLIRITKSWNMEEIYG